MVWGANAHSSSPLLHEAPDSGAFLTIGAAQAFDKESAFVLQMIPARPPFSRQPSAEMLLKHLFMIPFACAVTVVLRHRFRRRMFPIAAQKGRHMLEFGNLLQRAPERKIHGELMLQVQ